MILRIHMEFILQSVRGIHHFLSVRARRIYVEGSNAPERDGIKSYTQGLSVHQESSVLLRLTQNQRKGNMNEIGSSAMNGSCDSRFGPASRSRQDVQRALQSESVLQSCHIGMCSACRTPLRMIISENYLHPSTIETRGPPAPRAFRATLVLQHDKSREQR